MLRSVKSRNGLIFGATQFEIATETFLKPDYNRFILRLWLRLKYMSSIHFLLIKHQKIDRLDIGLNHHLNSPYELESEGIQMTRDRHAAYTYSSQLGPRAPFSAFFSTSKIIFVYRCTICFLRPVI